MTTLRVYKLICTSRARDRVMSLSSHSVVTENRLLYYAISAGVSDTCPLCTKIEYTSTVM